jgi:peptidoglycan hydrolase CwlO-like protein
MPWISQSNYQDLLDRFNRIEKRAIENYKTIEQFKHKNNNLTKKVWELEKKNSILTGKNIELEKKNSMLMEKEKKKNEDKNTAQLFVVE